MDIMQLLTILLLLALLVTVAVFLQVFRRCSQQLLSHLEGQGTTLQYQQHFLEQSSQVLKQQTDTLRALLQQQAHYLDKSSQALKEQTDHLEIHTRHLEKQLTALTNLELRAMHENLSGAECGRLLVNILEAWNPYGPEDTWQHYTPRRQVIELQAHWSNSCRARGIRPTARLWKHVVEAAYCRARDDLKAQRTTWTGEVVTLLDKIRFWRCKIPEAVGIACPNLLGAQRLLQHDSTEDDRLLMIAEDEIFAGDLFCWRTFDLDAYSEENPDLSPTRCWDEE